MPADEEEIDVAAGDLAHCLDAALPDSPGWGVDHTFEGRIIISVGQQAQVRQGILDLRAFVETQSPVYPVRDPDGQKGLFEDPRLSADPIEDRDISAASALTHPLHNAIGYKAGLVDLVEGRIHADGFTLLAVRPKILAETPLIVGNEGIGRV